MKKLDFYLAKKFLVSVIFILMITAVVSVIFDVSEKMDDFIDNKADLHTIIFDYYLNFIPNIINLTSPLLIFLACLYFTSRLANTSEILAMLSSGISYYRILVPYMLVALLLAGTDVVVKNYIIPIANGKVLDFELNYIQRGYSYDAKNIHRQLDDNSYFYAQSIDYGSNRAFRFSVERFDGQKLVYKLTSNEAEYDTLSKTWLARMYVIRTIDGMHEHLESGDTIRVKIPISMQDFGQKVKSTPSMTTPELNRFIEKERFKGESLISFYLVEKHRRFAMPFAIIILVLIAVALATRKIRGGIGAHLLIGILIAISYELFMRFSTTFATNADFPPMLAVWLPNIVYGTLAFFLIKNTPK